MLQLDNVNPDTAREKLGDTARAFARIRRDAVGAGGVRYAAFRNSLTPDYTRAWRDVALGYVSLIAIAAALILAEANYPPLAWCAAIPTAFVLGYILHFLSLYFHAAAHYNLSASRTRNDWLANLFLGTVLAHEIKAYRVQHLQHHQWHGTTKDPENGYFSEMNAMYFLKWLCGVETIRKLLASPAENDSDLPRFRGTLFRLGSLSLHGGVALVAMYFHYFAFAFAWALSVGIFYPLLSDARVILEHRRIDADPNEDYKVVNHGAFTRMFRGGVISYTFGGAGFNRHLLHHLDPAIPFERLGEMESFLRSTEVSTFLDERTSTYRDVARNMLQR